MKKSLLTSSLLAALLGAASLSAPSLAQAAISVADSTDGIVAMVNDEIILKSELIAAATALAAEYQANNVNAAPAQIQQQALDELITRKIQLSMINRAGFTANDAVINRQMLQIAQSQGHSSLSELQRALDGKQAGSYAALRRQLIEDAAISALWQHQVSNRINVSDQEIDAFLKSPDGAVLNQTQYRLIHVRIPYTDDISSSNNKRKNAAQKAALATAERVQAALATDAPLQIAMNSAKGNYPLELQGADTGRVAAASLPTSVSEAVQSLQAGDVSAPIVTQNGIDVVKLVEKDDKGRVLIPEWQTSHILARVDDTQTNAIAEQKINAIYAELQKGANFNELAATYSDDAGTAAQRGSLGWVGEDEMVPEFEAAMKNTEAGDYSTPFRTQFGWHILKVDNVRERDVTEQYRRNAARELLFSRIAPQAEEDWIQELRASAYVRIFE
ncbi:peptidylprolyl isomerase [Moraxella caviae]|uniref:Chaperone SurA n=1 Tax=Moraxella caviae TaxID=34060 RepID=A0A1T0A7V4_9GAMM|nr:peptidylprolyl isomerase [Moraxella caviae]OOR91770.1 peptidylprolyl isomerase [Moraxella caviae]STZ14194.1 Peptidyl-prolyl cis-trans isomerase surA [Moraxella caviae]VEW13571.1 Peptidyl-prolyl cis-trans isomerase surA [Moraxella caviae]